MEEVKKYLVRTASTPDELETKINEYAATHYVAHLVEKRDALVAVLSQRSDSKYDGILDARTVPIDDAWEYLIKGWTVLHHTSKEFVLVNRSERKDTGVQE